MGCQKFTRFSFLLYVCLVDDLFGKRFAVPNGFFFEETMKKYECTACGFIYDEAEGWPEDGIAPGTRWADVPDDWECPDCGMSKDDFEMIEV